MPYIVFITAEQVRYTCRVLVLALPGVPVTDNICGTLNPVGCDVSEINEYDKELESSILFVLKFHCAN